MPSKTTTKHLVVDLKTGFAYGIKLDSDGVCLGVSTLNSIIETPDGRPVSKFGPSPLQDAIPYGQTTYAVELTQDGKNGEIFTLVWPAKEGADNGALPTVVKKTLPADLVKAGIAPPPKGSKVQKGAGVDDEQALKEALKNIDSMIGLDRAKHDIKQNIALAQFNRAKDELGLGSKSISRHMVFTGNPGTGKTTFAREVAKVYHALGIIENATVHEVKREDLVAGFIGQTALKTKEAIDKAKGGILFIDEAYALSRDSGPGSDGKDFGREAIDTLVAAMENMREDLIVIVAGYPDPMKKFIDANEGLKSRFMTYISFDDYGLPQLGQILDTMLKERGYTMEAAARDHAMKLMENEKSRAKKDFGNGRTVRNLVEKAEKELALRLQAENKLTKNFNGLSIEEAKKAFTTITLADLQSVSLDGLTSTKKPVYTGIGFPSKLPANDAAGPAVPAGKKSHPPLFRR